MKYRLHAVGFIESLMSQAPCTTRPSTETIHQRCGVGVGEGVAVGVGLAWGPVHELQSKARL
jgi:hypothetical protein